MNISQLARTLRDDRIITLYLAGTRVPDIKRTLHCGAPTIYHALHRSHTPLRAESGIEWDRRPDWNEVPKVALI